MVAKNFYLNKLIDVVLYVSVFIFWFLTYSDYEQENHVTFRQFSEGCLLVINAIIFCEVSIKTIGYGFWMDKGTYCNVSY